MRTVGYLIKKDVTYRTLPADQATNGQSQREDTRLIGIQHQNFAGGVSVKDIGELSIKHTKASHSE